MDDAYLPTLAQSMHPKLDRAATCRAKGNSLSASNDEPELFIDRGPLTQPAELMDDDAFLAFDLARSAPGKGERLARVNDQHAAALDEKHLDAMRRAGL
jgi:hypothetical protein